jgi:hypothetical protein
MCHAGWDQIVSGDHIERGTVAYLLGLPLGVAGISFHWWKDRIPVGARDSILRNADRWWPAALIMAFIYVAGPILYQRMVASISTPRPLGRITWNFEEAAHGFSYFLNMIKVPGQETKILGFQAHGKNNSGDPVSQFSGYLRSDLTNAPLPIYILAQDDDESKIAACIPRVPTLPRETFGIPSFADFDVGTYDKSFAEFAKDGISLAKFLSDFVPFTVVLEYDGTTYTRHFSKDEVAKQIDIFEKSLSLESIPRVLRKANATPSPLVPLHPLVPTNATPVPSASLPALKLFPLTNSDASPTGTVPLNN